MQSECVGGRNLQILGMTYSTSRKSLKKFVRDVLYVTSDNIFERYLEQKSGTGGGVWVHQNSNNDYSMLVMMTTACL